MQKFTILGPVSKNAVVGAAVFRDAADGAVPGVRYFGIDALFPGVRLLDSALTSHKLRLRMAKSPALNRAFAPLRDAALRRTRRVTLRRVGGAEPGRFFLFCPSTHIERFSPEMLDDLRAKCPGCRLVYYLVDSVERTATVSRVDVAEVLALLERFDAVFTYDKTDAARYAGRMRFIEIPLWRAPVAAAGAPTADLYFCGRDKKRDALLMSIYRRVTGAGGRCHFRIVSKAGGETPPGIDRSGWVPYEQTVRELAAANCILEVLADLNNESTLRYKEAVLYNKKLLTNNPNIATLPYYDARWMRTFQTAEDIDPEWVRTVEPVDYGYQGDYSLDAFLCKVEELTPHGN